MSIEENSRIRLLVRVYGIVQGVGFRPFVARIAGKTHIAGSVCNKGPYVEIYAEGTQSQTDDFLYRLEHEAPERSSILKVEKHSAPVRGETSFRIIESEKVSGDVFVSPDIATCPKCRSELFDKKDRRYLHPFINCTACGPRLTILDSMPYDRVRTSMKEFPMCPDCAYEYTHEETRRYHAQPVCCPSCGPHLYVLRKSSGGDVTRTDGDSTCIMLVREILRNGGIAAVKGIGGFHLCCDALNEQAVSRLRALKHRPYKPFAVMMRDMNTVNRECIVLPGEEKFMDGPEKPILLLERKRGGSLCKSIAPGNPSVGVMLPYAPVQMLLFSYPDGKPVTDCFVMTSGNPSGAPICRTDEDALAYLLPMCDAVLSNNRTIRLRADDSVMAWNNAKPYMIRRSRGYAPLPFMMSADKKGCVLGIGGELKNTFCLAHDSLYYLSPYVGDLADVRSVEALKEAVTRMETLLELKPEKVVCDMHPKYNSAAVARELGLPVVEVQHHYAHILSCMAENDWQGGDVIGVSFDGTGYGTDGTIWGGEFMRASYTDFTRLGSIKPFVQAGGDLSAKEGWRIAVQMLDDDTVERLALCDDAALAMQRTMASHHINSITSTSAGRLFDAASAVLGFKMKNTFEGEASMALEFAAEAYVKKHGEDASAGGQTAAEKCFRTDSVLVQTENGFSLATDALLRQTAARRLAGEDTEKLAYVFHTALADMIVSGCRACRDRTGISVCALSGGVFQNLLLVNMCRTRLETQGFRVLTHSLVPANDGGIALGQAVYGMNADSSLFS
jgi:hydrogenase maturation protein HypF